MNAHQKFPTIRDFEIRDDRVSTVNARDLHNFLGNKDHFITWMKDRISQYGFAEETDYATYSESSEKGRPRTEYALTLDMAKELAMVERNDQGKRARQYFIECERKAKAGDNVTFIVPKSLPDALRLAADLVDKVEQQTAQITAMKPKADFHDRVAEAINCHTFQEVAKILGTGQNRLFKWARSVSILMRNNQPYQRFVDDGYFRVVERQYNDERGESHTYSRTLITGKGLQYLHRRFERDDEAA